MKFSAELIAVLDLAAVEALGRREEYVTPEHLLFGLLHDPRTSSIIEGCDANVAELKAQLEGFLDERDPVVSTEASPTAVNQSLGFQRILHRAAEQVHRSGREQVDCPHILVAFFDEPDCEATWALEQEGLDEFVVQRYIAQSSLPSGTQDEGLIKKGVEATTEDSAPQDPLEIYCTDLVAQARAGVLDPLVGRKDEMDRALRVLARRRKNNPLFLGEPGVGKSAMVEGLAQRIAAGNVPDLLADAEIFALDMGALMAGTRYRGDFEARVKQVLGALEVRDNPLLFIDEIHSLVGAGATHGSAMDASNLLKPALSNGQLQCIGATTFKDYRSHFESDAGLARRFQIVEIREPSERDALRMIEQGQRQNLEEHHQIRFTRPALKGAVELSARYIQGRALPDKAIDILDEAGARARLSSPPKTRVGVHEIETVVSSMTRIPTRRIAQDERAELATLSDELKQRVYGQDEAVDRISDAVKRARAGLRQPDKPVGSFLFWGPTGVGKTELAKALADHLGLELLRFDMSEYMERHAVSRLIGAPPGYVGFDQGGLLTDALLENPRSVVLLDEIEKAHSDLFNILLQVMDSGQLTDNNGRKADFRNAVLIMTSNAGARQLSKGSIGFGGRPGAGLAREALERAFSPEFRNRLDAMIDFEPLSQDVMSRIVDKMIDELRAQLKSRKVDLCMTPAATAWLANRGYDPAFGARPLGRLIDQELRQQLADDLLFGALVDGGKVTVTVEKERLKVVTA